MVRTAYILIVDLIIRGLLSPSIAAEANSFKSFDYVFVGVLFNTGTNGYDGAVFIFSGHNGDLLFCFVNAWGNTYFGCSVSGSGNMNNDDFNDIIVGGHNNPGMIEGRFILSCSATERVVDSSAFWISPI